MAAEIKAAGYTAAPEILNSNESTGVEIRAATEILQTLPLCCLLRAACHWKTTHTRVSSKEAPFLNYAINQC